MRFLPWNCPDGRCDNKINKSILSIILASIKFTYCSKHFDGQLMWYKNEKICLPCGDFSVCLTISMNQIMGGLVLVCKCISFLDDFLIVNCCLLVPLETHIWKKTKLGITNWPIEGKKTMFYIIVFIAKIMADK